jgi:cyclase
MGRQLVKTVQFERPTYIGDPINAVRIFNEREVDELAIVDVVASRRGASPDFGLIEEIVTEAFMPVSYGGGIRTTADLGRLFRAGVEKAIISTHAVNEPGFIGEAAALYGSQSIVACLDVKKNLLGGWSVFTHCGTRKAGHNPVVLARQLAALGAGEMLVSSIDRDGTMSGYDSEIISAIARSVTIPIIACGGAANLDQMREIIIAGGASAAAAGSVFVFQGKHRAVLISYPDSAERAALLRP